MFRNVKLLRKNRKLSILVIVVAVLLVVFVGTGGVYAYNKHKASVKAKEYQASLSAADSRFQQLLSYFKQYVASPRSITRTESDWGSYFSNQLSQVQSIQSASNGSISNNSQLNKFNSDIEAAAGDFATLITLNKSSTDMQFQIQSDQTNLNTDEGTLTDDQETYQIGASYGVADIGGDVVSAQSTVNADKQQLASDQHSLQTQNSQAKILANTAAEGLVTATNDQEALGL